jgi:short-subunit dehydrogenase
MTGRPLALVTGASSGIGLELARRFGANGFSLLLAADEPQVLAVAAGLGHAEAVVTDLSSAAGVRALYARVDGRPVDVLALNAGIVAAGAFATDGDLARELALVDLNVRSTVHLAKLVIGDMAARGHGRVLFTSSIVAGMPGPYQSTYNASKSFVQSFALALRDELRDTGVTVTVLMPGPTDTPIFARAGMLATRLGATRHKDDPADVARDAYDALMQGRERVVAHSLAAKAAAAGSRLLPERAKAALNRFVSRPRSASTKKRFSGS